MGREERGGRRIGKEMQRGMERVILSNIQYNRTKHNSADGQTHVSIV